MPDQFVVRPYQSADQSGVEWLFARTPPWGRTYPRPHPIPDDLKRIPESYSACFVAVEQDIAGEAVVGLAAVERAEANSGVPIPDFIDTIRPAARIHWVLVAPERWRRGIGRTLTLAAIAWSKESGFDAVLLETTPQQEAAVALYESLGFAHVGRSSFANFDQVWLKLDLATPPGPTPTA